jgi:hypothetical protein
VAVLFRRSSRDKRPSPAAIVAALAAGCLLLGASAGLAHAGSGGGRTLAVSVPADPIAIAAGRSTRSLVRLVNPGDAAVRVTIESRELSLGDNGKVSIGGGPDPRWQHRARFPSRLLTVPARGYLDVPVTIHVPRLLPADLYFIGFLVTPVATETGSIHVINQIGSFLTVDVPGPRLRELAGRLHISTLVFGSKADGTIRVSNIGKAAVRFWGENDTIASPGGTPEQIRLDPSLLPAGKSRSIKISGAPAWPIGTVTITTHLTYPGRTEATTRELTFSKRVLVVSPWLPIVLGPLVLLLAGGGWWSHRRRRRGERTGSGHSERRGLARGDASGLTR